MIAIWMLYASALSLCFGLAALALERAATLWARPRRFVWVVAILATLLVPLAGLVIPRAAVAPWEPAALTGNSGNVVVTAGAARGAYAVGVSNAEGKIGSVLTGMNRPLVLVWGGASLVLAFGLLRAAIRLRRRARGWRATDVDGTEVLIAPDMGPAVVRLGGLRVVLPEWALSAEPEARAMMLRHEHEHRQARDPDLLLGGTVTLLLAPWALPLWWQVRRLQLAVETDCDRRVMGAGIDAHAYGMLLLSVGARTTRQPLLAPAAFSEERSLLERRIEAMTSPGSKRRLMRTAIAAGVSAITVAAACVTPRPAAAPAPRPAPATTPQPAAASSPITVTATRQRGWVYALRALAREDRPTLLSSGPLRIPDSLRTIEGRVVLQWVIDTTGHAAPGSLRVLSSSHQGFEAVAREQVLGSTWRPGRIDGRAVAVQFPPIPMVFPVAPGGAVVGFPAEVAGPVTEPAAVPVAALPPGVYAEDGVTERPQRLSSPPARYPDSLRTAGIGGRVLVEVIVDSTGHADSACVRVLSTTHPGFEAPARDVVLGSTFAPGRLHGRAVPVMVRIPINFVTTGP
jgi:TonB family protein